MFRFKVRARIFNLKFLENVVACSSLISFFGFKKEFKIQNSKSYVCVTDAAWGA